MDEYCGQPDPFDDIDFDGYINMVCRYDPYDLIDQPISDKHLVQKFNETIHALTRNVPPHLITAIGPLVKCLISHRNMVA